MTEKQILTCLKCGKTHRYDNRARNIETLFCKTRTGGRLCNGMLYHTSAFKVGVWKLNTGRSTPTITGRIAKPVLYKRMMQGGAACSR